MEKDYWIKRAADCLLGHRIVSVAYMRADDAEKLGWYSRPLMFELDNGTWVCPQRDDEGNDGGALNLFPQDPSEQEKEGVLPVMDADYAVGNNGIIKIKQGE